MKKNIASFFLVITLAFCLMCSFSFAAKSTSDRTQTNTAVSTTNQAVTEKGPAPGTMRAVEPKMITCAKLSQAIQADKAQVQSILGYLHDYGCYSEPAASSVQCVQLFTKRDNLLTRIEQNQQRAITLECH